MSHWFTGSKCKPTLADRSGNFPQRVKDFPGLGWRGGPPQDHLDGPRRGRWPRVPAADRRDRAHRLPHVLHLGREAGLAHLLPHQPGNCYQVRIGFLFPDQGTAIRASVHIKLPLLARGGMEALQQVADEWQLQVSWNFVYETIVGFVKNSN